MILKMGQIRGILIAWAILTVVHLIIYHLVAVAKLTSNTVHEFEKISQGIGLIDSSQVDQDQNEAFSRISRYAWLARYIEPIQEPASYLISLPILQFIDGPRKQNASYYELSIPLSLRLLNSALAGAILQLIGFLFTRKASRQSRLRKFFGGEASLEEGELPYLIDRAPMIRSIRYLKNVEKDSLHRVVVLGVAHFALSYIIRLLEMSENISNSPGIWTIIGKIMRFPVSPLLIEDFDTRYHTPWDSEIIGYLLILNSLFVGVCLTILIQIISRTSNQRKPNHS